MFLFLQSIFDYLSSLQSLSLEGKKFPTLPKDCWYMLCCPGQGEIIHDFRENWSRVLRMVHLFSRGLNTDFSFKVSSKKF